MASRFLFPPFFDTDRPSSLAPHARHSLRPPPAPPSSSSTIAPCSPLSEFPRDDQPALFIDRTLDLCAKRIRGYLLSPSSESPTTSGVSTAKVTAAAAEEAAGSSQVLWVVPALYSAQGAREALLENLKARAFHSWLLASVSSSCSHFLPRVLPYCLHDLTFCDDEATVLFFQCYLL